MINCSFLHEYYCYFILYLTPLLHKVRNFLKHVTRTQIILIAFSSYHFDLFIVHIFCIVSTTGFTGTDWWKSDAAYLC